MFEFLGLLFGVCVRTGVRFPLDLPAFVWKALIGRSLTRQDLVAVDAAVGQRLSLLESTDDAAVVESLDLCFVCALSDGAETELKPDGANVRVTHGNRMEYVRLVLAARLTEHQAQVEALRRGMSKILPLQLLNILTWQVGAMYSSLQQTRASAATWLTTHACRAFILSPPLLFPFSLCCSPSPRRIWSWSCAASRLLMWRCCGGTPSTVTV